ncbi:hypothetical protein QUC31_020398 [Theobroma cacao]
MLVSRLSRLGFRAAKELSHGGYTYISRTRYKQRPCGRYQRSLGDSAVDSLERNDLLSYLQKEHSVALELLPETRAFQGAIFQQHHDFSTSASNSASEGGDEQKETISVTFVSKDGEEMHIQVPIGMSMLEAAHENDIELEGKDHDSLFIQ